MNTSIHKKYVHGYNLHESTRLQDQAVTLVELLHSDTSYPAGSKVLEAGCGVGAQTITLARNSPDAQITSIDISENSLKEAKKKTESEGIKNVNFQQGDIFRLSFEPESFDHIFVCFVLEHLSQPLEALKFLKRLLKKGGTITVIEGDHGSTFFHPDNDDARKVIDCQVQLQAKAGGNANIGRELYPLLDASGFSSVCVSPRFVYVDSSKPKLVEGFTKNTFTAMIKGIHETAVNEGLIDKNTFDKGIKALYKTAEANGVFCYTFFKAVAVKETLEQKIARVTTEEVDVEPYNPLWKNMFETERDHLLSCVPSGFIKRIEHFGSTAVPGLSAKPIVDMLVEVESLEKTKSKVAPVLEAKGYDYFWRPSFGDDTPPFYAWFIKRDDHGKRTHHIHMIEAAFESWERLLFRDYLIEHSKAAKEYSDLKIKLSKEHKGDRITYTKAKTDFITEITNLAKEYYK